MSCVSLTPALIKTFPRPVCFSPSACTDSCSTTHGGGRNVKKERASVSLAVGLTERQLVGRNRHPKISVNNKSKRAIVFGGQLELSEACILDACGEATTVR